MSASNKKKLRKEQQTEMLTARQRQEQAEAKKLKMYTIGFIAAMLAIVVAVVCILVVKGVKTSGIIEKNTIAANVNGQQINSVEATYYYKDAIGKMYENAYNSYGSLYEYYFQSIGLDLTQPLDQQNYNAEGKTWAEYFFEEAMAQAKFDYTFAAKAEAENFTLPEDIIAEIDTQMYNLDINALAGKFTKTKNYLARYYCPGADTDSYRAYLTRSALATAFCEDYLNKITVEQGEIDELIAKNPNNYNSYDYSYVYLSYTSFLKGDDAEETTTHTEEEKDAARAEAKKLAEELYALGNLDDIRDKVNEIENAEIVVNDMTATLHTAVNTTLISDWLASEDRQPGEIGLLENVTTTEAEGDEEESTVINGYYVVCFTKKSDNTGKMSNVRHLLVAFEGGEEDEISGEMNYSSAEKETAKAKAEELLQQWRDGDANKESFIALVKKHTSDTGSAETGGLYENLHAGSNYVTNFLDWSINPERKEGDVEIIETEYGYHIMYFDGYSEESYRDHMITDEIKATKYEAWYDGILETATVTTLNTSKVPLGDAIAN